MTDVVLNVENLSKIFRTTHWFSSKSTTYTAVDNISFSVKKGEILGLLGPNGAGKTTTIHMLLDILQPTSGTIYYFGKNIASSRQEVLQKVGFATTYMRIPYGLSVHEYLDIYGKIYNLSKAKRTEKIEHILKLFSIWNLRNKLTNELSAGQTTRVMLAKAFIAEPAVVLLDEPTAALDPDIANEIRDFILEQQANYDTAILITSHNMLEVTQMCNRVLVMSGGKIIASGSPDELAASVATSYVSLMVGDGLRRTIEYCQNQGLEYSVDGRYIEIQIDEHKIAQLLIELGQLNVRYTQIWIDRPTLEDYFLHIAASSKGKS